MTASTTRLLAVVLAVMAIGGVAISGVAVAQETAGNDDDVDTQQSSYLRVIHASPDAPAVDIAVDNETVASAVEYGDVTDYLALEAGNHTIVVTAAAEDGATDNETANETASDSEVLFEGDVYLEQRTSSTLAATSPAMQTGEMDENGTDVADGNETDGMTDNATATATESMTDNATATETEAMTDNTTETATEAGATGGTATATEAGATDGTETDATATETEAMTDNGTEAATETATEDEETEGGAAEAPTDGETQAINPVLFVDNAWEPDDDEAAVSVVHLAQGAPAVDVTVADDGMDNESIPDENASDEATDTGNATTATDGAANQTVLVDDLEFSMASDYVTVPEGNYTLDIRQATETNDGDIIQTVNVSVEGGNAYSALAMTSANATDAADEDMADNATEEMDNETEQAGESDPLMISAVEDVTYTINLPGEDTDDAGDNGTEEADTETDENDAETAIGAVGL